MNANFDIKQMFILTCLRKSRQTPPPPPPPGLPHGRSPPGQGVNVEQFVIKKKVEKLVGGENSRTIWYSRWIVSLYPL